ncbi:ATM [Mytilus coruscus]|uniref:ATM n=1 Tax=Mytilus coruscus TaxID=42192 RepID=A0A6J8CMS9_MYTCO|nr:ATM [Mytilus coruscus]
MDIHQDIITSLGQTVQLTPWDKQYNSHHGKLTDTEDRHIDIESGWTSIRDIITSQGLTVQLTPWLQLITRVMEKFPGSLAEDETYPYLNCLSSLIAESKKVEISKYLLLCAEAFTVNWKKIKLGQRTEELCGPVWRKMWMSTLRCVSLNHATPQGYKLLKAMVVEDIIHPDRDMWSLFLPNISPPTQEAVEFLLCILQKFSLPELFQPSVLTSANYNEMQYPLRSQLIDWILPSGEGFSGSSLANNSDINPESVANVLVLLMIQNQSVLNKSEHCEKSSPVTDLEMIYLQSSHDFPMSNTFLCSKDSKESCNDVLHLPVIMSKIEKMLKDEVSVFLEITDVQLQHIEKVVSDVCLLSKLIYWLLNYGVVNSESLLKMDIVSLLKVLYKKLGMFLGEILHKEGSLPLQNILMKLLSLYDSKFPGGTTSIQAARLIRCLFPAKIVDQLLGIASNKLSKQPPASHSKSDIGHIKLKSRNRPSTSRSIIEDDDMDLEFDQPLAMDQGEEEDLDDDFGDSQESEDSNVDAFQSPLSSSSLTEGQTIRLTAIKVLCLWCGYDKSEMKEILPLETNGDPVYIRTKMEELIDEEELDSNKAFDLQMLHTIISGLTTGNHRVSDIDLENMVDAIRTACIVAFYGFLRCGEFTVSKAAQFDPDINLCIEDVFHTDLVVFKLKQSKTDPFRKGINIQLHKLGQLICPYKTLLEYIQVRKEFSPINQTDPLFITIDKKPLERQYFLTCIKKGLDLRGFNSSHYNGHSFRIGAATSAGKAKIEDHLIKTLGRWSSDSYIRCIRVMPASIKSAQNRRVAKQQRRDHNISCMCLELLGSVVSYLGNDEMPSKTVKECREITVHLLSAFWNLQDQFSSKVRLTTAKCMMAFIEADPKQQWALLSTKEDQSAISTEFIQTMCDLSHDVRMYASQAVSRLYVTGCEEPIPVNRHQQNQLFDQIYVIINETIDVRSKQGSLTAERAQDEKNNRTASALTTVGNIMCSSVVCENKAIFALCQLVRECDIEIKQVLQKVSYILGYKDGHHYMSYHIPYVLNQWLGLNYPVAEFPYQLAFCSSLKNFYRDFCLVIIPQLIMKKNVLDAKEVVTEIKGSWNVILRQCIPHTVIYMLPLFAVANTGNATVDETLKKRTAHATACYDLLTKEATKEVVEKTIVSCLDEIVVNILKCLYDPEEDFVKTGSIRNIDPEPNPPCYNPYMIRCTLDYVTNSFSGNARTLVDVLSKNQDSIQKILLDISMKLNTEHRLHEKRRLFLMYQQFVKLLLREFSQQLGGSWAYVLRETIHRLVYIANDVIKIYQNGINDCGYSKNIICMSLQLLKEICTVGLETCPEELSKYLPFIVGNIVQMATSDAEDISNEANLLLQLLIIDNYIPLRQAIISLDPFPSEEKFHQLSTLHKRLKYADGPFTLVKEIDHFMRSASSVCNVRKEGLQHLSQQLHENRKQLCQFTSQDREKDSICQLICKLVQVYQGSKEEVTLEISKCLGEIGPVDLEQNGLPRVDDTVDQVVSLFTGNLQNYYKIFHMLNQYLVDNDMSVVEAASNVLKTLLSTKTGIEFANLYRERLGDKDFLFQYLHPFRPRKKIQAVKEETLSVEEFQRIVDMETLWTPPDCSHDNWIHNLTCTLINAGVQDEILSRLQPICMIKTRFSEIVLPLVIHDLLLQDQPIHREVLSSHIRRFFSSHCEQDSSVSRSHSALSMSSRDISEVCRNKDSIRSMLNVVQYLRQQDRPNQGRQEMTAWDNNFWLDLDFLHIAKAAMYCSAHFSVILFAEIWCDIQRQKQDYSGDSQKGTGFSQSFSQTTMIDSLGSSSSSSSTINVQDLLLQTYQEIGDPDGLYGCGAGRLADTSSRVKSYEHENRWEKAVITYDIEMCQPSSVTQYELLHALQNFGSNHLLERYLHTMSSTSQADIPNHIKDLQFQAAWKTGQWNIETTSSTSQAEIPNHIRDLQFKAAWKTGQWNIETTSRQRTSHIRDLQFKDAWKTGQWNIETTSRLEETCSFNEALYSALTAVKDGHCSLAKRSMGIARMLSMQKISTSTMESARCLYPILADLQCVSQIDNVLQYNILKKEGYDDLTSRWNSEDSFTDNDFMFLEPTLNIRCSILKMLQLKHDDPSLNICLQHQLLKLAQLARESNRHQIAERAIFNLKHMETDDLKLYIPKLIEEANLYWTRQEQNTAKHLMKNLMTKLEKLQDENIDAARFYPQVLSIYGNWLAETRSENPNVIMEEYLEKTVGLLESLNEQGDVALDAYLSLARYADNQYQNIVNYMKSNTYEAKQALMKKAKMEMETLKQLGDISKDRYYKILSKQSDIDKAEIEAMNEDKTKYLQKAVENYLKCLKYGDKHDLRIFRLISLWFSNTAVQDVNTLIEKSIKTLKSYKFIPLMYQLAARMDTKAQSQSFQATLNNMIERAAKDHPHHTLSCVLALAHYKFSVIADDRKSC